MKTLQPAPRFDEDTCPWSLIDDERLVRQVTEEAGRIALSYFARDVKVWEKSPNNPVCEADFAVDEFLRTTLMQNRTGYGWLSEETEDQPERLRCGRLWIVDPIDGTRSFLEGGDNWGISVALVQDQKPVVAAFYAPVKNAFYFARAGKGATRNGQPIQISGSIDLCSARMMGDPDAFKASKYWPTPWPPSMYAEQANSIALRLCQVADGQFDCCVTLRPKNDWDVAAADLIVREAGGLVTTGRECELVFNRRKPLHEHIVASTPGLITPIMDRVEPALEAWHKRLNTGIAPTAP
ncbi:3'(2'),5'-bisphosphate nucleotidase CysQ [Kordiimonas sediminis]|uniref:3'(2'),5'-bisphosphate nucleotidase CysQ n=1 Tax=Kordiimonas sediminis TaxID=1735581 RepID=A0A919E7S0_9PROT|nr:3'(2'),5'-bisphosphate nucleotidase CysQ [Kordiimonas sediminis]GHF20990.1 3'(2'),5'-bisphosphate nucleotidase CysQ [Kordiimonas sediminis]